MFTLHRPFSFKFLLVVIFTRIFFCVGYIENIYKIGYHFSISLKLKCLSKYNANFVVCIFRYTFSKTSDKNIVSNLKIKRK